MSLQLPKVIFLDAMGTLFGTRDRIGKIYSDVAANFGVNALPEDIDKAFYQSFAAAPPLAFPDAKPEELPEREFEWWQEIALRTFHKVGVLHEFPDFGEFFSKLYFYFETAEPWVIYPDVVPALRTWKKAGIELGVISNFDSRLHQILKVLDLDKFFTSVTVSTEAGFAKPEIEIFEIAMKKHNCYGSEAWHAGDSLKADYQGARLAGMRPFLLQRGEEVILESPAA